MIPYSKQSINEDDIKAVSEALRGDFLTGGKRVEEFERAICEYVGVKYCVAVNSATSALHLAYICAGLKKGDKAITTPLTFSATSSALLMVGASPLFCDIKNDGNINEDYINALVDGEVKAIVPVDFGGKAVNINKILKIAKKNNLLVIDDASHALGSSYEDGSKVGSKADISVFSFHAIKPITTFEGGALVTNNSSIYSKAKLLRSHGIVKKELWDSELEFFGYNYRLSDVACALGQSQLKRLDKFVKRRNEIASYYDKRFENKSGFKSVKVPSELISSRHLYPILLDKKFYKEKRNIFKQLLQKGIGVQVHYKPLHLYELYKPYVKGDLNNSEEFYKGELSLPCHQEMSLEEAKYVADSFLELL